MVGKRWFSSRKFWTSGSTYYLFILFIGEFILSDNNIKALYYYKYFISRDFFLQIIKWNVKNNTNCSLDLKTNSRLPFMNFDWLSFQPITIPKTHLTTIGGWWYFDRAFVLQRLKNQSLYNKILLLQKFNYTLGKVLR